MTFHGSCILAEPFLILSQHYFISDFKSTYSLPSPAHSQNLTTEYLKDSSLNCIIELQKPLIACIVSKNIYIFLILAISDIIYM